MTDRDNRGRHCLNITDRGHISLNGIEEVLSFDENSIVMQTNMGQLTLDGSGMNIVKLNLEESEVEVEGRLDALYYMEQHKRRGLFSGLFG